MMIDICGAVLCSNVEVLRDDLNALLDNVSADKPACWRALEEKGRQLDQTIARYRVSEPKDNDNVIYMCREFYDVIDEIVRTMLPEEAAFHFAIYRGDFRSFVSRWLRAVGAWADDPNSFLSYQGQKAEEMLSAMREELRGRDLTFKEKISCWKRCSEFLCGLKYRRNERTNYAQCADMIDGSSELWKLFEEVAGIVWE